VSTVGERLDADRVDQLGREIADATNMDELRKVYFAAYREAEAAKDRTAMQLFINTAKARKREIR
jgi:hypothetical protein